MKDHTGQSALNTQILEEASAWFVEFSEGDVDYAARRDFNQWLRISPEHVRAYLRVSALWDDAALFGRSRKWSADELIARARSSGNVLPITTGISSKSRPEPISRGRQWNKARGPWAIAASIAILLVAGVASWMAFVRDVYSTGVGEQRSITLSDGSTIELNARSRVRVRFGDTERIAILLDGQALFHVAKDSARPFVVRSDAIRVRAVGTQFDVNQTRGGAVVTVLEGKVAVLPSSSIAVSTFAAPKAAMNNQASGHTSPVDDGHVATFDANARTGPPDPIYVGAGEQVTVIGSVARQLTLADAAAVTAWRQHKLQFAAAPLTEVADEYNRYHEKRLIISDPRLEEFHVSGVFSATDSASLLEFLRQQPTLTIRETASKIEITGK